jgi:UDP-N-acetylglucosamine--N-acetylmuramyl-(pentapeptide) pyrophosphoryl-undecaprenol N-acetylglucosamine transferase
VAEELRSDDPFVRIVFAGSERDVEQRIISNYDCVHRRLSAEPSTTLRGNPARFAWRNWRAVRSAKRLLREERPAVVIGTGGFASVPVVLAAAALRIPTLLLEQNISAGRANRWLSLRASLVCLSFEQAATSLIRRNNCCVTGNPVRRQISDLINSPREQNGNKSPTLLVLGGSQGAKAVNEAMVRAVATLRPQLAGWRIVHQAGERDAETVRRRYQEQDVECVVSPFFGELVEWYRQANVVVSRAGATSLAELACAGCPAVLIPYPNSLGNHQWFNAQIYASSGAARVVEQQSDPTATSAALAAELTPLLANADQRDRMSGAMRDMAKPRAARSVAERIWNLPANGSKERLQLDE